MKDDLDRRNSTWEAGERSSGGMGEYMGQHAGRGPRGYHRQDDGIMDDVCERLTWDPDVDASEIEVRVESGVVTLGGAVNDRRAKRRAEDLAVEVRGVVDVLNRLRVRPVGSQPSAMGMSGMAATPVVGIGAAGLTGTGDGTTATSGGSIAGVANMPSHNNPDRDR